MENQSFAIQLTDEQRKQISEAFGQDVSKITMSVEEFTGEDREAGSLKVLKIENVAAIANKFGRDVVVN